MIWLHTQVLAEQLVGSVKFCFDRWQFKPVEQKMLMRVVSNSDQL
jgi:hypothetical protein